MKLKKVTALVLALTMTATLAMTGCGKNAEDSASGNATGNASGNVTYTTIGTMDGEDIDYALANFMAKVQQASYDSYYRSSYGDDMWSTDLTGSGSTLQDSVKANILTTLESFLVFEKNMDKYGITISDDDQAAITKTAKQFIKDNKDEGLEALGATQDVVERYLYLYTVANRAYDKITADVDTNVTDKEAAQKTVSYVKIDKGGTTDSSGNYVDPDGETLKAATSKADTFVTTAATDWDQACKDADLTASTYSYSKNDPDSVTDMDKEFITAAEKLAKDEISPVVETESAYYVIRMDSTYDKEATDSKKEEIVSERKSTKYSDELSALKENVKFNIIDAAWGSINFTDSFTISTKEESDSDN